MEDDKAKWMDAWLPNALRVFLSQEIIDDGDHTEAKVDDMGHLLEVLLGNVNFADLIGKPVLFEQVFKDVVNITVLDDPPIALKGDLHLWIDIDKIEFGKAAVSLKSRDGGIDFDATFAPEGDAAGMTVHLKVHVQLTLAATAEFFTIPVTVALDPPPEGVTTTSLTIDTLKLSTSFDIHTDETGALKVAAKKFGITPEGIYLAPLDALTLALGTVTFEVAGFPLPFTFKLPDMDLSSLVSGIDDLVGGLVSPILDAIVPLVTTILEPLVTLFGADAITGALQSLELDQVLAMPELFPGQPPAEIQIKARIDTAHFTAAGGAIGMKALARFKATPLVGIVMGSDSDLAVMDEAVGMLKKFGIPYEMTVASAHRSPGRAIDYASRARDRGMKVIIAGAGHAAHLAGILAAHTSLPVVGVPVGSSALQGMDALFSTVQMPPGIPVATMAIGKPGARNAGILAAQIIGLSDGAVSGRLDAFKDDMALQVERKAQRLNDSH